MQFGYESYVRATLDKLNALSHDYQIQIRIHTAGARPASTACASAWSPS